MLYGCIGQVCPHQLRGGRRGVGMLPNLTNRAALWTLPPTPASEQLGGIAVETGAAIGGAAGGAINGAILGLVAAVIGKKDKRKWAINGSLIGAGIGFAAGYAMTEIQQ